MLSRRQLIARSLGHYWRIHLSVALAVVAATAVLTGALIVGDAMRGSLRDLVLSRLGNIDHVILSDLFFRQELAGELESNTSFDNHFEGAHPAFLLRSTAQRQSFTGSEQRQISRASGVLVWGLEERFVELGDGGPATLPNKNEIVLNDVLAHELNADVGDQIILRLPQLNQIAGDSVFADTADAIRSLAGLKVVDIIPAEGLGRFGLSPTQHLPLVAFVQLPTLQSALKQSGKINAILLTGDADSTDGIAIDAWSELLHPTLGDYGFSLERVRRVFPEDSDDADDVIFDYYHLTSNRLMFPPEVATSVENALATDRVQPVFTYLANSIGRGTESSADDDIPYSMVTAIDSIGLKALDSEDGSAFADLEKDEIVLNSWASQQLGVKSGDTVHLKFFEPESTHGMAVERQVTFRVREVVPITEPLAPHRGEQKAVRPTWANDPHFTPEVEGFTDRESLANADPPFPFDRARIRERDETYWANYRTTPKAFVSSATGKMLWGTARFGQTTSYRIPVQPNLTKEQVAEKILAQFSRDGLHPGFRGLALRHHGLQAAKGTTPFSVLFLGFSFFLIAAAMMLVALLFRLGIQQRAHEIGILKAVGWTHRGIRNLLIAEGLMIVALGAAIGVFVGIGYAWFMLVGLRTWWLDAVVTPFLELHIKESVTSLIVGWAVTVFIAGLTIALTLWFLGNLSARRLMSGEVEETGLVMPIKAKGTRYLACPLIIFSLGLALLGTRLAGEAQAGMFFGCGASVLMAGLLLLSTTLRAGGTIFSGRQGLSLIGLSLCNAARRPGRSTLTVGIVATAAFLIAAISCFRLEPSLEGAGGFELIAESDQPIYHDLNTASGREELGFVEQHAEQLKESEFVAFRVKEGDDASCLNLYQPRQPRVLGVPVSWTKSDHSDLTAAFRWADTSAVTEEELANPWSLLEHRFDDGVVPVILDKNTAMYSMHLYSGAGSEFDIEHDRGQTVRYRIVGLLTNSIFQGSMLISETYFTEKNFDKNFSNVNGYRLFLVNSDSNREEVANLLEDRLRDHGFDARQTKDVLRNLLAVQNTYLSTFQSLGALGLLLGTFGLATVQLRSVLERRGEMALMLATGFRPWRLAALVMLENAFLLLAGLGIGAFAAGISVLPHWLSGGAAIPFASLAKVFGLVLLVGLASGFAAVRATLRAPVLSALRGD